MFVIPGDTPHNKHSPFHLPVPTVHTWLSMQSISGFIMLALLAAVYYTHLLTSKRWELNYSTWMNRLFLFQWSYRSSEWWHMGTGRSVASRRLKPEDTASGKLGISTSLYPWISFLWFEVTFIPQRTGTWPFQHFLQVCISLDVRKTTIFKELYIH